MKKILSVVLCLCMLISILPTNVFAANITIFNVTVNKPKVGEELSYEASVPETASTYVTKVEWNGPLDALGKVMPGKYEVRVTVRIKDGMDDKYIKKPSKDTVKVNGNSADLKEITADKKQAVVVYTFTITGLHEEVKGQEIVNTESQIMDFNVSMDSYTAATISAALATATPSQEFGAAPQGFEEEIQFQVAEPIAGQKHNGKVTTTHPDIEITSVTWGGQLDSNGAYIVGNTYSVVIAFKIKDNINKEFIGGLLAKSKINGESKRYTVGERSDRVAYITKDYVVRPLKAVVDIKNVFTQKQADERWVTVYPMYSTEIIINPGETLGDIIFSLSTEQKNCVKKIVLNCEYVERAMSDGKLIKLFPNLEELWLGPEINPTKFFGDYEESRFGLTGDEMSMPFETSNLDSQKMTAFVHESNLDKMPEKGIYKRFTTKLYSGDVMEAYAKGPSAGREWCTNHDFSDYIYTPDRVCVMINCQQPMRYYYSCSKCGKCEYNPNHTTLILDAAFESYRFESDHYFTERDLSDKYFIGVNSRGERVYWKSCAMCGGIHNDVKAPNEHEALPEYELEGSTLKQDGTMSFAVRNERYVSANMSSWAQNDVQWASQNGILDLNILGSDYTAPITRLQFASVAVKLAECLIGVSITPAPQGTFVDTDNEYALKAYASGITSGVSATEFNPNGTLNRQQMATFIHRALMYVRDNTNIRYTTYTPVLDKYSDSRAIQSWAKTPMGFMNALGLVKGVSDTAIDPDGKCTIEQAVVVANRSVNADQIGWYQMPLSTEEGLLTVGEGYESRYYFAPVSYAPTQTAYYNSTRIWVDTPASGGQKASENPWYTNMIRTVEPYTGTKAWVPAKNFRPIKDLKDTDAAG